MVYRNNTGRLGFWLHQCVLRNTLAGSKIVVSTSRNHPVWVFASLQWTRFNRIDSHTNTQKSSFLIKSILFLVLYWPSSRRMPAMRASCTCLLHHPTIIMAQISRPGYRPWVMTIEQTHRRAFPACTIVTCARPWWRAPIWSSIFVCGRVSSTDVVWLLCLSCTFLRDDWKLRDCLCAIAFVRFWLVDNRDRW